MKSLTLRDIPEPLYRELKRRAAASRRSLNSEVLVCLERVLASQRLAPDAALARADAIREHIRLPWLTDEELRRARDEGRP